MNGLRPLLGESVIAGGDACIQAHADQAFAGKVDKFEIARKPKFGYMGTCQLGFGDAPLLLATKHFDEGALDFLREVQGSKRVVRRIESAVSGPAEMEGRKLRVMQA